MFLGGERGRLAFPVPVLETCLGGGLKQFRPSNAPAEILCMISYPPGGLLLAGYVDSYGIWIWIWIPESADW